MNEWTAISSGNLPDTQRNVLFFWGDESCSDIAIGFRSQIGYYTDTGYRVGDPDYWMPLPNPPVNPWV